ncbi:hypothetical protein D3C72_1486100 [compost metagenome]
MGVPTGKTGRRNYAGIGLPMLLVLDMILPLDYLLLGMKPPMTLPIPLASGLLETMAH